MDEATAASKARHRKSHRATHRPCTFVEDDDAEGVSVWSREAGSEVAEFVATAANLLQVMRIGRCDVTTGQTDNALMVFDQG